MMSLYQYFDDAAVSPGRLKLARELIAILCARPIPASSIPPHHNGMSFFTHRLWIRLDSDKPPTTYFKINNFTAADFHGLSGIFVRRSEEHTSELQSRFDLVCRLLLEKK